MKRRTGWCALWLASSIACAPGTAPAPWPTSGRTSAPQELAARTISTGHEFGSTFTLDGTTVLFSRPDSATRRTHIQQSRFADGRWSAATALPMSSAEWSDLDPSISPDGRRLYFVSTRRHAGSAPGVTDMDIWYADATTNGWGEPHWVPSLSSRATEGSPTTDRAGRLCFFSDRDAPAGTNAIYCADPAPDGFAVPQRQNAHINAGPSDTSPFLAPDGQTMLFYSTRPGGAGSADLYVAFKTDGDWGPAVNLGPAVNTAAPEYNPVVSRDGRTLIFGRSRRLYSIALDALGVPALTAARFR